MRSFLTGLRKRGESHRGDERFQGLDGYGGIIYHLDSESPALLFQETSAPLPVTKGDMAENLNRCDKLSHIFCTQELLPSQYHLNPLSAAPQGGAVKSKQCAYSAIMQ